MNTNIHEWKRENGSQTIYQTGNKIRVHSCSFVAKNVSPPGLGATKSLSSRKIKWRRLCVFAPLRAMGFLIQAAVLAGNHKILTARAASSAIISSESTD